MFIRRGSYFHNTWSIDHSLFDEVMQAPEGSILEVSNKKGRKIQLTQDEVETYWTSHGFLSSAEGHPVKVVRFPWHPLA